MKSNVTGKISEFIARTYYRLLGYKIIAKNYITGRGTHAGELDFIASKGKTLVFVEVKKRTTKDKAAYAISKTQQSRIRFAAESFIAQHQKYRDFDVRIDAVLIVFPFYLKRIKNAF